MKYVTASIFFICALTTVLCTIHSSSQPASVSSIRQSWKDKEVLDSIVGKNPKEIYRIYGVVKTLEKLNMSLNETVYGAMMLDCRKELSGHLEYQIKSNQEMNEILEFFVTGEGISTSDKVKAMFTFGNILLILAIVVVVLAFGSILGIFIIPYLTDLSTAGKVLAFYVFSGIIIASAFITPIRFATYVGFLGALAFGGTYIYNLSIMGPPKDITSPIFIPPLLVWGTLAIALQSRLIGFITIMDFAALIGFGVLVGPMCIMIGFDGKDPAARILIPSGVLIVIYTAKALGAFKGATYYMDPFDAGAFFIGTFVYFSAITTLSSGAARDTNTVWANILAIISGLAVCALGFLVSDLAVFRGVGLTFFVIYLLEKYIEISWGKYWSCSLLGLGVFLTLVGFAIKDYGSYFVFWNY